MERVSSSRGEQKPEAAHLGDALDLWRVVRVVGVDRERKLELSALVHACSTHAHQLPSSLPPA